MIHSKPLARELEVSVFGKGFGECLVVHLGDNKWAIIDSFRIEGDPIALTYLRRIGVDVTRDVLYVIATHWHDDHIKGLWQIVAECENSCFVCTDALSDRRFKQVLKAYQERHAIDEAKLTEIYQIFSILKDREATRRAFLFVGENTSIYRSVTESGSNVELYSLSPSSQKKLESMIEIGGVLDTVRKDLNVRPLKNENDLSIAIWLRVGNMYTLLGADLEEHGRHDTGWSAVIASSGRPTEKCSAFKIPHHGSATAEHPGIWAELLLPNPQAIVTPFTRLPFPLPRKTDAQRILLNAPNAVITSVPKYLPRQDRRSRIQNEVRMTARRVVRIEEKLGHVRLRADGSSTTPVWSIETDGAATPLRNALRSLQ